MFMKFNEYIQNNTYIYINYSDFYVKKEQTQYDL